MEKAVESQGSEGAVADDRPFAVIRTGGKQYRVSPGERVLIERIAGEKGAELQLTEVLIARGSAGLKIGRPLVEGASVSARIVAQERGEKCTIFKKRRRKGYMKKQGHRQELTRIQIESISA